MERKEEESTQHFCDRTVLDNRIRIVRNAVGEVSQQVLSSLVPSLSKSSSQHALCFLFFLFFMNLPYREKS